MRNDVWGREEPQFDQTGAEVIDMSCDDGNFSSTIWDTLAKMNTDKLYATMQKIREKDPVAEINIQLALKKAEAESNIEVK